MILDGLVEPVQLGAFLCVLRVRTEEPGECAGFIRAVRRRLAPAPEPPAADLDWPSNAGKARRPPWYLLAALLLAANGVRVCMQGAEGHTEGRLYTPQVLRRLGIPLAGSIEEAAGHIAERNFAYLPLSALSPRLQEIIDLRPVLGLRSPINTFARMINPCAARYEFQTIFHPGYRDVHRQAAKLLGQPHMAVFKGEGGEAERRPDKPVLVQSLHQGMEEEEEWPPMLAPGEAGKEQNLDPERLAAVWRGSEEDAYATAAITGTAAIALRLMGRAGGVDEALAAAGAMWEGRDKERLGT